jgi:hypothetical protein
LLRELELDKGERGCEGWDGEKSRFGRAGAAGRKGEEDAEERGEDRMDMIGRGPAWMAMLKKGVVRKGFQRICGLASSGSSDVELPSYLKMGYCLCGTE